MEKTNLVKKPKNRYSMVTLYHDSRTRDVCSNTNELCVERLNTIFDDLTENWGVFIGKKHIEGLNGDVLQHWFIAFEGDKKNSTLNNYISFLNPFLRWAYNIGYIPFDLSHILRTKTIKPKNAEPVEWMEPENKYLTHEQADNLLHMRFPGRHAVRNKAIVALILFSGIRSTELCSLTLKSVFKSPHGKIYCQRKGGCWSYVEVGEEFYNYLGEYLAGREDLDNWDAPLFVSERGGHMDRKSLYYAIAPIQKKLGLVTGCHALRHTYISEIDKLAGPTVARDLANHKSLKITNRYDHSTEDQRREALEKLRWTTPYLPE